MTGWDAREEAHLNLPTHTACADQWRINGASSGFFFLALHFFDRHIAKFVGVEHLAAIEAFDELGVIFAGYDAYLRVFTDRIHGVTGAARVGMGQIVPGWEVLSTAMLGRAANPPGKLEPCPKWNECRSTM
jgi:hypothetical protein